MLNVVLSILSLLAGGTFLLMSLLLELRLTKAIFMPSGTVIQIDIVEEQFRKNPFLTIQIVTIYKVLSIFFILLFLFFLVSTAMPFSIVVFCPIIAVIIYSFLERNAHELFDSKPFQSLANRCLDTTRRIAFVFSPKEGYSLSLPNPLLLPVLHLAFKVSGMDVSNDTVEEEAMVENALLLKDTTAKECMVPRNEIEAVSRDTPIAVLRQRFVESQLSRIIVYKESLDNLEGYVHHLDILSHPDSISDIIYPIKVVPESVPIRGLLNSFKKEGSSILWVVDEFGGTAGIITLEDVLEEIFGEIKDEHDVSEFVELKLENNTYILSGRLEIDYLNEKYDIGLPEGDYETIAGYVLQIAGRMPTVNESFTDRRFRMEIVQTTTRRIDIVKLILLPDNI